MYTEDYENRGFPFRDFLLKLILIIIFVFLLVWLLPKFIKPTAVENKEISKEISAISSQIFQNNLDKMKEAAILYYTEDKLPKEQGASDTMTLGDMIGKKIITPLIDKNNKAVDTEKSYVKITKSTDEYILKINIKDSEKEDYILVHIGCYAYCNSYVCEKKTTETGSVKPTNPPQSTSKDKDTEQSKEEDKNPGPDPEPTPNPDSTPNPESNKTYVYEYTKTTGIQLSNWSTWGAWEKTSCDTKTINCSDSDSTCLLKLQRYDQKEKIGTFKQKHLEYKQISSYEQTTCSNYNYVIIDNKTYTTTTSYSKVSSITSSTASSVGDWKYIGREKYSNPPADTATIHYEFVGADYNYCIENCQSLADFYYDKYVYVGSMSQVSSTTKVPSGSSTTVTASCSSYTTKSVPVYSYTTVEHTSGLLYGTVCYKSTKTRTVTSKGTTQYKWSSYNDTSLLNNGWKYTGNKKLVS